MSRRARRRLRWTPIVAFAWVLLFATVQTLDGRPALPEPGPGPGVGQAVAGDAAQGLGRALLAATCDRSFDADVAGSRRIRQAAPGGGEPRRLFP